MDEADQGMQAEQASQAGSIAHSDRMELEHEDLNTVRDAEMEIHDIEAEGTIEDMKAAITADDAEMAAEMQEQEHLQAERDWKDVDADVVHVDEAPVDTAESVAPTQVEAPDSHDIEPAEQLEDSAASGDGITDTDKTEPQAEVDPESGQQSLEEILKAPAEQSEAVTQDSSGDVQGVAIDNKGALQQEDSRGSTSVAVGGMATGGEHADTEEATEEQYTEQYEPVASTSAVVIEDYQSALIGSSSYRRPPLQKDYLAHVEVFSGAQPLLRNDSGGLAAPHISLLYNNDSYSLFRPSSTPSGDDEKVLFDSDDDQQLYYSTLDTLICRLHEIFPNFRGDGDNELILDFGILDMSISEDNVYTQQVTLHDVDRIRVGMSQPELDRLQITLLIGKRFVYKFNELAEHVYRMHAGSEYDSGTIYDETVEEEEGEEGYEDIPEYYEEGAAEEDAFKTSEEAQAVVTGDDIIHGLVDQGATPGAIIPPQDEAQDNDENQRFAYPDEEEEQELLEAQAEVEEEEPEAGQEIHPPSDEYYEDPEFSQQVADAEEGDEVQYDDEGTEQHQEQEGGDDSETVQDYTEYELEDGKREAGDYAREEVVETELTIDPDAPLGEVAQQVEEYEEGNLDHEEDVEAEAEAAASAEPVASSTSVNVEAIDRDTERIYEGMDSLAAEQHGKVDPYKEPAASVAPEFPTAKSNGVGKRSRDEGDSGTGVPIAANGHAEVLTGAMDDHVKRPRVSPEA